MTIRAATPPWVGYLLVVATLVAVWILSQTIGHVLLVFLVSVVAALLLNPLVRMVRRGLHLPRGVAVLVAMLAMVAALVGTVALIVSPVRSQVEEIQQNLPVYTDQANRQVENLQQFANDHGIKVDIRERTREFLISAEQRIESATGDLLSYGLDIIGVLFTIVVILVCVIYMVLDAPRILAFARSLGGPPAAAFLRRTERSLNAYVKAQVLVSLIIGVSAGVALWLLGVVGIFPLGATFAVAFTVWVFLMEFVPYVGPILGALPPVMLALVTSPSAAIWVVVAFIVIHQFEGHVVVPQIMGDAVGVHPLVVIFGLLIGEQVAGLMGMLIAIPSVVIVKEAAVFAADHLMARRPTVNTAEEQELMRDLPDPEPRDVGLHPVGDPPAPPPSPSGPAPTAAPPTAVVDRAAELPPNPPAAAS